MLVQARWTFTLYPQAGEGGGCFAASGRDRGERAGVSPIRARSQQEAARRARAKLRRYCAANRLNRLGTLTYAARAAAIRGSCGRTWASSSAGCGASLAADALPYAWTSEWHPGGHGLHVHFAVGRYVRQRLIRDVWGRGIVHIKLIGDLPRRFGALEEARVAASYLAKYVEQERRRRAARRRGCIGTRSRRGSSRSGCELLRAAAEDAIAREACERMGGEPSRVWRSSDAEGWRGPPALLVCLAD